jgi:DNA-binding NarL/FixJ family response regulator
VARNRILIADQNLAIRQTLVDLLQEDCEIVAAVDNEEAVFEAIEAVSPNIVLLGIDFKGTSAFKIARQLRQSNCTAKIIIVSLHESRDLVRAALAVGVSGYVFMSRLLDDLPAAIDAVCHGRLFESGL